MFNKWSILKHPQAYKLILHDFDKMNLSKVTLNYNIWQKFMDIVIKFSSYNTKCNEANLILQELKNENVSIGNCFCFIFCYYYKLILKYL